MDWFDPFNWEQRRLDEFFDVNFTMEVAKRLEVFAFWFPKMEGRYGRRHVKR